MNDRDFLHAVLADHRWHGWHEIMRRSNRERGCGLTIHSRAADLRRRGHVIDCRSERKNGRTTSSYRLVPLDETPGLCAQADLPAHPSPGLGVSSSGPESAVADGNLRAADPGLLDIPGQLVLEGVAA